MSYFSTPQKLLTLALVAGLSAWALRLIGAPNVLLSEPPTEPSATVTQSNNARTPEPNSPAPTPSAGPSSSAGRKALPPWTVDAGPVPRAPTHEEWNTAPEIEPTRRGRFTESCRVHALGPWLRIRCETPVAAVRLLGGNPTQAMFSIDDGEDSNIPSTRGEAIFSVGPGEGQVVMFTTFDGGDYGPSTASLLTVQAHRKGSTPYLSFYAY